MVIMPSAASNDAPTSRLVAIYEEHVFKHSRVLARNPDLVLVDTSILAEAPRRLLVAGIGDALSKKFEVDCSVANSVPNTFGMQSLLLSRTLADRCYELIRIHAISAIGECEAQRPGEHFERLVEACVLYSGLAFEGGGLSLAHGLLRGLTCMPETERFLHGELVPMAPWSRCWPASASATNSTNCWEWSRQSACPPACGISACRTSRRSGCRRWRRRH